MSTLFSAQPPSDAVLEAVHWDAAGLVTAIAQEQSSGRIVMVAWMNREALVQTLETGYAVYWSRSRSRLWRKGESSGHQQRVLEVRLDCDGDAILLQVAQSGGIACHTGRHSCFYKKWVDGRWVAVDPVLRDPSDIYS
jgi:phosphoribosyl-AMP cyclohydrolase